MFSNNFKRIGCSFADNKIFEKSKMASKLDQWQTCCETAVAIATVLN